MTPVQESQSEAILACPTPDLAPEAIRSGLFVGLWMAALGFGWWLSVPVPIQETDFDTANLIQGVFSALGMALVWVLLTDLDSWSSKCQRVATLMISLLLLAWAATTRGTGNWIDLLAHATAMLVELRAVLISTTHNPWWVLTLSQVLFVTSLWICVRPFWIRNRWPNHPEVGRQKWLPALIVGGCGLVLVTLIYAVCSHFNRYPYYGPAALIELSDYNRIAGVFAGFFPLPLLWLTGGQWWKIGRYFALLAVLLGLGICEANGQWIGQRLDYQQRLAYFSLLGFTLGAWSIYLWLGGWLVIGQLGLLSRRPAARPPAAPRQAEVAANAAPSPSHCSSRRLLATWLILMLVGIALPRYLEPVSFLQPPGDWQTARSHAQIHRQTQNFSSHRQAAEASKRCRIFRQFPAMISPSPWELARLWRLVVDLDTALDPDFLAELEEQSSTKVWIVVAVDADPTTLTDEQSAALLDFQFHIRPK